MQTFQKGALGTKWQLSESFAEVPPKIAAAILKSIQLDQRTEPIRLAAFADQLGLRGDYFVVLSDKRVAYRIGTTTGSILFSEITSVTRNDKMLTVMSAGNKARLFSVMNARPPEPLVDRLYALLQQEQGRSSHKESNGFGMEIGDALGPCPNCPNCSLASIWFESRQEFICTSCRAVVLSPANFPTPIQNSPTGLPSIEVKQALSSKLKGALGLILIAMAIGTCLVMSGPSAKKKEYMDSLQLRPIMILTERAFKEKNGIGVEIKRSGDYVYYYYAKGDFTVQTDPGEGITVNVTDGQLFD